MRRDTNAKEDVPLSILPQKIALLLVTIQHEMLEKVRGCCGCCGLVPARLRELCASERPKGHAHEKEHAFI